MVEHGGCEAEVFERLAPLRARLVGGCGDRGAFISIGRDLERQWSDEVIGVDLVALVQTGQLVPAVAADETRESVFVVSLRKVVDQGGGRVAQAHAAVSAVGSAERSKSARDLSRGKRALRM